MRTVVITGAAGRIGSSLREGLRPETGRLILVDRVPLTPAAPNEEVRRLDLTGPEAAAKALEGADAVIHLAGIPDEAPLPDLLEANVLGTHHILEAARRQGVRRVILASSNRLTGFYPVTTTATPDLPPRPDGLYGVSKVAVETLARLYVDKFGLSVVCLRIGSFEDEPADWRHLSTWLSPRDCLGYVRAALTAPDVTFAAVYAVSANTRRFWDGPTLGYTPVDDAEHHAAALTPETHEVQGGAFADQEYTFRHLEP